MGFIARGLVRLAANALLFWAAATHISFVDISVTGGTQGYIVLAILFSLLHFFLYPLLYLITIPLRILFLGFVGIALSSILVFALGESLDFLGFSSVSMSLGSIWDYIILGALLHGVNTFLHWSEK